MGPGDANDRGNDPARIGDDRGRAEHARGAAGPVPFGRSPIPEFANGCLGPECAARILEWLARRAESANPAPPSRASASAPAQASLFPTVPYSEESPVIRDSAEFEAAVEHLEYALFRRHRNQLTRAERARLDNTIQNALFKLERYAERVADPNATRRVDEVRQRHLREREHAERLRLQARRADLKLAQLRELTPEGFEEFVAELFECLGYEVERVGGADDRGVDLNLTRGAARAIVQCKYFRSGVVGSPELQKFLGAVHRVGCHKGYFVTTSAFSLAAERLVADQPVELIDGPRLVELVKTAIGPGADREPEPAWF